MRFRFFLCILLSILFPFLIIANGGRDAASTSDELIIYTYDSFASEWGPGPAVLPIFEEKTGIKTELFALGDAGQVLSKAILEKDNPGGDILLGIDNNMLPQALEAEILLPYQSPLLENVIPELLFDDSYHLTPFDYGNFAIIYDTEKIENPPTSLAALATETRDKSLILMDPRTSSPGFGFLLWTIAVYGDDYLEYWKTLSPKILTIAEGWDSGYGLFTNGEAPMVLSYTSSPAYHVEYEESTRYQAIIFDEGNYGQIEGLGILRGGPNTEAAKAFVDFVLSIDFQQIIPLTNWMYPVRQDVSLPYYYNYAPKPKKNLFMDPNEIAAKREEWIKNWTEIMMQ